MDNRGAPLEMLNSYCLPGRAGGQMEEARVRVVTSEATPMRRSAADAVTATQSLKHNALIVRITRHPPVYSIAAMITPAPRKCNPNRQS
jgi:hypothetical protein